MVLQGTTNQSASKEKIPVVLTGYALQSLRDSGYSLSAALGEVIDNSLEANANNITLLFEESKTKSGKRHIHQITIIDDGDGMELDVLQRYLQLGYSTRYMRTDTIGKYGVGAKLAALNYGQRIDVWSRTNEQEWYHVWFDLEEALIQEREGKTVGIDFPDTESIPDNIFPYAPKGSGTIVLWSKVDRLEEGQQASDAQALKAEVKHELARMFRYFLHEGIRISFDGTDLLPHDPLYLMKGTWADREIFKYYQRLRKGTNKENREKSLPLPEASKEHFPATQIARGNIKVGGSICTVTVTLYPSEVARERGMANDNFARKILRLQDNQGAISFVRLNREINYTNVPKIFPKGVEDRDRFIGIEVAFKPELDSYFGVRNVKRGVEPHDELRTEIRNFLNSYIEEARNSLNNIWGEVTRKSNKGNGEHLPVLQAVKEANLTLPKSRVKTKISNQEKSQILVDLARDVVGEDKKKQEEYQEAIKDLPFVVEFVDIRGNLLIDTQHIDGKVIITLNTRHPFYREMWEPLRRIADAMPGSISGDEATKAARRSIEALTLLIIAYGKAESMDDNPREHFSELRSDWGKFTDSLMGKVKDVI
ncbi:MAG: ATP-binding protein [Phormidium sp.]